jgi:hypothetical protein
VGLDINEELEAGLELVGFSSQGDRFIDGYWGLNAPYTAHDGSGNTGGGPIQPLNHQPFTRMVMDRFWLKHKPSDTSLTIGSFQDLKMAPLVYLGQNNANLEGPLRLNFGFRLEGDTELSPDSSLDWEVFKSRIGSRNLFQDTNYFHHTLGADVAYKFHNDRGAVQLNFARYMDEALNGEPLVTGLLTSNNVAYGASSGWTPFQWVNPPGYYAGQRSAFEKSRTGAGEIGLNTVDNRPIPGWSSVLDSAAGLPAGGGNYGPQSQNTYGVVARYRWDFGEEEGVGVRADYAVSQYRPNRNSPYDSVGDALRIRLDGVSLGGDLGWQINYLSVDPRYGPARFRNGLVGARFPSVFNVFGAFHPHDFVAFPHNREGVEANLRYGFNEDRGSVWLEGSWLSQKETSLYDVRVTPGALGPATPNLPVIGFSPGFVDYYFPGYAHPGLYGPNSGNSFTPNLAPLEDNRGYATRYEVGTSYEFEEPNIDLRASYRRMDFKRPSSLSTAQGGSQNLVDVGTDYLNLLVGFEPNDSHRISAGLDLTRVEGHHDPGGLYNAYSQRIQSTDFSNIDSLQTSPFVTYRQTLSEAAGWEVTARHFQTTDQISSTVRAGRAFDTIGSSIHPFEWSGWQITTQFDVTF